MPSKVLVVEDDDSQQELLRYLLKNAGYLVQIEAHGKKGLDCALALWPDVVVLDLGLPDMNGLDVLKRLKADLRARHIPVLILSGFRDTEEVVLGLKSGADDYMAKPFHNIELLARVEALLRRPATYQRAASALKFGPVTLDSKARSAKVRGRAIPLSPKEFDLIEVLIRSQGRVLSRADLLTLVWGHEQDITPRTVDFHVSALRKKLGSPLARALQSFYKRGYALLKPGPDGRVP